SEILECILEAEVAQLPFVTQRRRKIKPYARIVQRCCEQHVLLSLEIFIERRKACVYLLFLNVSYNLVPRGLVMVMFNIAAVGHGKIQKFESNARENVSAFLGFVAQWRVLDMAAVH